MTDKSQQHSLNEVASALMDGQASEFELRRFLQATEQDVDAEQESVRAVWQNYHLIGQSMRNEDTVGLDIDLSDAIRAAIDDEPALNQRNWLGQLAKMAVAASVAGVVVMTSQFVSQQSPLDSQNTLAGAPNNSAPQNTTMALPSMNYPAGYSAPIIPTRTVSGGTSTSRPSASQYASAPIKQGFIVKSPLKPSEDAKLYLKRVMEVHANQAALNNNRGMLPYARSPQTEAQ